MVNHVLGVEHSLGFSAEAIQARMLHLGFYKGDQ